MYSKQEASRLRQEFWTTFGQYMMPVLSAEGEKVNWTNYKTGEKDISFRMNADNLEGIIGIELTHKDPALQQLYFEQFLQFKNLLHATLGEDWNWLLHARDENGKVISKIWTATRGASIFKKEDWPRLISFFKPRIIGLDLFWSSAKYAIRKG
jgi:hypothetical protein